jgi:hypothetical protein
LTSWRSISCCAGASPPAASRAKRAAVRICAGVRPGRPASRATNSGAASTPASARRTIASRAPGGGACSSRWYWKRRRKAGSICSMRLVIHSTGTGLVSRIWLTQALPPTELGVPLSLNSSRAISCAVSPDSGGNTSSTSSNSSATLGLPLRNTWLSCSER